MSILSKLKKMGACQGGIAIYYAARAAAAAANTTKQRNKLSDATKRKFRPLFPRLDLDRVRIRPDCTLPPNWFTSANDVNAMTFGYTIYCKGKHMQSTKAKLNILMHELVHIDQIRRRDDSESRFACNYGEGYVAAGNYRNNPLEVEAYNFVAAHSF